MEREYVNNKIRVPFQGEKTGFCSVSVSIALINSYLPFNKSIDFEKYFKLTRMEKICSEDFSRLGGFFSEAGGNFSVCCRIYQILNHFGIRVDHEIFGETGHGIDNGYAYNWMGTKLSSFSEICNILKRKDTVVLYHEKGHWVVIRGYKEGENLIVGNPTFSDEQERHNDTRSWKDVKDDINGENDHCLIKFSKVDGG